MFFSALKRCRTFGNLALACFDVFDRYVELHRQSAFTALLRSEFFWN